MDISIITASIGSFVLSERVIKAKAWILAVLGTVVTYDLTQTSEDPWSLRVYRGPALVAFIISCVAASLRIWRRSGVACDELLFLPGTPIAARHFGDVPCPEPESVPGYEGYEGLTGEAGGSDGEGGSSGHRRSISIVRIEQGTSRSEELELTVLHSSSSDEGKGGSDRGGAQSPNTLANEADAAAGMMTPPPQSPGANTGTVRSRRNTENDEANIRSALVAAADNNEEGGSSGAAAAEGLALVVDADERDDNGNGGGDGDEDEVGSTAESTASGAPTSLRKRILERVDSSRADESMIRYLLCSQTGDSLRRRRGGGSVKTAQNATDDTKDGSSGGGGSGGIASPPSSPSKSNAKFKKLMRVARRLGLHKFIRSKPLENDEMTYAPSGPSVAGAAVDLCLPVLFNFHMFFLLSQQRTSPDMMGGGSGDNGDDGDDDDGGGTSRDAPEANTKTASAADDGVSQPDGMNPRVLPLIFLSVLFIRSAFPPKARRRFWGTIKYTVCAPFYAVYFRDAFIGDVFTSLVRPIQDLVYCLFYYSVSVWAMISSTSSLDEAGNILRNSWVLHNFALPACAVLPLWWKFLQSLRQARDSGQHWPHLGNSFKYLTAALVIFYAIAHPEGRRGKIWIASFLGAMLYQIWWDVVMDWELLVVVPRGSGASQPTPSEETRLCNCCTISSLPGSSYILIPLHRYAVQPVMTAWHRLYYFLTSNKIALRPKRLYARDAFYWRVLAYNVCFRFIWMLSFIPAYHFSHSGKEVPTLSIDFRTYVGAVISVAELIRRCLWCIIKLELETIKVTDTEREYEPLIEGQHLPLNTMDERFGDKHDAMHFMVSALKFESQALMLKGVSSGSKNTRSKPSWCTFSDTFLRRAFIAELVAWALAFIGFSILCVAK